MVVESISGHGFEVGDMVWAKVKYSPWWPGHVYSEEFATPLVRQSKREGLLLVAFFGASTYGWFDPSELIPFESNYADKSRQTNSKTFVRAVEDAVAEVSRRCGLGLSCTCRNKHNFRKTDVKGFVSVDVVGCDPGAVYSIDAIGKARDSFQPNLTIDFLRQLSLEPTVSEHVDIDFIKNRAAFMAYRKAAYEDQAFGYDPVSASIQEAASRETSSKAPLRGKKVFADSLGKVKNTAKLKEHAEKDVYLFKRRDECKDPTIAAEVDQAKAARSADDEKRIVQEVEDRKVIQQDGSPNPGPHKTVAFQTVVSGQEKVKILKRPVGELSRVLDDLLSLAVDPCTTVNRGSCIKGRKAVLRFRSLVFRKSKNFSLQVASGEPNAGKSSVVNVEEPHVKPQVGLKQGPSDLLEEMAIAKRKKVSDVRNLTKEKKVMKKIDESSVQDDNQPIATLLKKPGPTMLLIKFPQGGSLPSVSELKTKFACYGPMDHSATQILRDSSSCQVVFRHRAHALVAHRFVVGSSSLFGNKGVKCRLKEVGDAEPELPIEVSIEEDRQPTMEDRPLSTVPSSSGLQLKPIPKISGGEEAAGNDSREAFADGLGKVMNLAKPKDHAKKEETGLSHVLSDLHSLAVDPFNTVNRGSRVKVKRTFLRFRSRVFQKSQNFSLPLAAGEPNASKSSEDSVQVPPVKPQGGLKRGTADFHKEMAAAKKKRVGDVANLTKEKKETKKIDEPPARDVKQPVATTLKKPGPQLIKKTEQQAPEPTMLMIKFPQGGSLPSYNELKATFTPYGPMDHSATHIFWNTFSCQVLFRHKAHALAAHRFVLGRSSLFGNTGVKCSLKGVGIMGSAGREPPVKVPKAGQDQPEMEDRPPSMVPATSSVQLKSILKKSGEEAADSGGRGRVKFILGGEESQMNNNMENKSGATSFSSHLTMDSSSKNFQKAVHPSGVTSATSPPPPPSSMHYGTTLLTPPSLPTLPSRSMQMTQVLSKPPSAPLMTPNADITQQMLTLLTRCHDVVTNVSSIFGYTPYHPL